METSFGFHRQALGRLHDHGADVRLFDGEDREAVDQERGDAHGGGAGLDDDHLAGQLLQTPGVGVGAGADDVGVVAVFLGLLGDLEHLWGR